MIEITEEIVSRVEKILAGVPKGAERALSNAINRGLSKVKTGAVKRVTKVYTVQSSTFTSAANTKVSKSSTSNLSGFLSFSGYKIPLYKFQVTPKSPKEKSVVNVAVKKGHETQLQHAFVAQMSHGHLGVFERKTKKRFPVKEFMGLSAVQMVWDEGAIAELETEAEKVVNERIEYEINRLLNGYGE